MRLAATTNGRSDTALGAFYRRLSARVGKAKAVTATARKIAVLFYNSLQHAMAYHDPGATQYEERYRNRVIGSYNRPRMTMELKEVGLDVGERRVGRLMRLNGISPSAPAGTRLRRTATIAQAHSEAKIEPNRIPDHIRREPVPFETYLSHHPPLTNGERFASD